MLREFEYKYPEILYIQYNQINESSIKKLLSQNQEAYIHVTKKIFGLVIETFVFSVKKFNYRFKNIDDQKYD